MRDGLAKTVLRGTWRGLPVAALVGCLIVLGCIAAKKADTRTETTDESVDQAIGAGDVDQQAGGDAWHISPQLQVAGGANLAALAVIAIVVYGWWRERKATSLLIKAIEVQTAGTPDPIAGPLKRIVEHNTELAGIGRWFHRRVKRTLKD